MFDWFKKKKQGSLQPEAKWYVTIANGVIECTDNNKTTTSLNTIDLSGVIIETNDSGPWGADVWWLFFGNDDKVACMYPQGATGEQDVLDYLMKLHQFNIEAMIKAMSSTENAVFPVWRRQTSAT